MDLTGGCHEQFLVFRVVILQEKMVKIPWTCKNNERGGFKKSRSRKTDAVRN